MTIKCGDFRTLIFFPPRSGGGCLNVWDMLTLVFGALITLQIAGAGVGRIRAHVKSLAHHPNPPSDGVVSVPFPVCAVVTQASYPLIIMTLEKLPQITTALSRRDPVVPIKLTSLDFSDFL